MIRSSFLMLVVAGCALASLDAQASNADEAVRQRIAAVAMGVTMGVFFHELAHAMIGELELSATGPEEDTADEFSALVMSGLVSGETEPLSVYAATYSSLFWYYSALEQERARQPHPWQNEHAPNIRRFRHSFCLLYGSNPALYRGLAVRLRLDQEFKARCPQDYNKRFKAWESILEQRARNLSADLPGVHPADMPGGRVTPVFLPTSSEYGQFAKLLFDEGVTELLEEFSRYLVWPRDLLVEFRDCGEANAYYIPDSGTIRMCYEMIEFASQTVLQAEGIAVSRTPAQSAMAFVQGTWIVRLNTAYGLLDVTMTYQPDQAYRSDEIWVQSGSIAARVVGAWSAEPAAPNQLLLHLRPDDWWPEQFCYHAACQPHVRQPATHAAQVIDQNTMHVDGVVWQRTR